MLAINVRKFKEIKGLVITFIVITSLFLTTSLCLAETALLFRTQAGAKSIPAGQTVNLGTVGVSQYRQIRLVADERAGSAGPITIMLTITEGNEPVAFLDTVTLQPHQQLTRVYDVPGTKITVSAQATSGAGAVDVLIYGYK